MRWTYISTLQTKTSLGACRKCLCWLPGLSGSPATSSTPTGQPRRKPAGQMYSSSAAVRSAVADQQIGDDAYVGLICETLVIFNGCRGMQYSVQKCTRGAHVLSWGHWDHGRIYHRVCDTRPVWRQTNGLLPSCRPLPQPLGWYLTSHPNQGRKLSWPEQPVT